MLGMELREFEKYVEQAIRDIPKRFRKLDLPVLQRGPAYRTLG
jgi:predicted Zn-dependent protease with MMP-like domain